MVFEQIDQLKKQYTDKYVVVDETRPELRRFRGQTGIVRTVNMSGRALVEFDAFLNIGWYDIELDFLKVVDKPLEKEDAPKKAAAPAAAKPAAKKPAAMSVEEMLAAARANKTDKPAAAPAAAQAAAPAADAKPAAAPSKSLSVEEMLAAARANKPTAGAAAATGAAAAAAASTAATPAPAAPTPEPAAESAAPESGGGRSFLTSIPEIIEYCRKTDGA